MANYIWTPSSRRFAIAGDFYHFDNEPHFDAALIAKVAQISHDYQLYYALAAFRNYVRSMEIPHGPREAVIGDIYNGRAF